tara:strand:- start:1230 stop:2153 length:924 start_codon:yes stop_codon:yes gene_type:complete
MLKPVNENLDGVTITDVEDHKLISNDDLNRDLKNLKNFDATENRNNFYGNPFLYHFQFKNLLNCKREKGKTIYELYADKSAWSKLIDSARKRNRGGRTAAGNVFECFRINLGSIVMFKSTTAKYLYKKYSVKSVLDPTAGWGGRMLGAWALGINYTGIDTNTNMKSAYDRMMEYLGNYSEFNNPLIEEKQSGKLEMIWQSALDVDFSKLEYDFVLTSPPYVNLEIYEHMAVWDSDEAFYKGFFIPIWQKCVDNIQTGGHVCFNISPKMYDDAVANGLPVCDDEEDLKQQLGQQTGKKKQDKIYIWKC